MPKYILVEIKPERINCECPNGKSIRIYRRRIGFEYRRLQSELCRSVNPNTCTRIILMGVIFNHFSTLEICITCKGNLPKVVLDNIEAFKFLNILIKSVTQYVIFRATVPIQIEFSAKITLDTSLSSKCGPIGILRTLLAKDWAIAKSPSTYDNSLYAPERWGGVG